MHFFDAKNNFLGGYGIVGGHLPLAAGVAFASKYRGDGRVMPVLLRRRRGQPGRRARGALAGRAVEAAGRVHLREQPVLDGHAALPLAVGRGRLAEGAGLRHGARSLRRRRRPQGARPHRRRGPPRALRLAADADRDPHLPLPRPLDVRPGPVPHQGRGRGVQEAGLPLHRPAVPGEAGGRPEGARGARRERQGRDRRRGEVRRGEPGAAGRQARGVQLRRVEPRSPFQINVHCPGASDRCQSFRCGKRSTRP